MKKTLAILALGLTAIAGHAATPLWMRDLPTSAALADAALAAARATS